MITDRGFSDRLAGVLENLLNMSDGEHPDFADSCADVVEELWLYEPLIRSAIVQLRERKR